MRMRMRIDCFIIHLIDTTSVCVCLTIFRASTVISLRTHAESVLSKIQTKFATSFSCFDL